MSSTTCDADISFGGDFFADDFHNTNSIKFWHSRSARYGNTNDLALLIDGSNDDRQEYIRGLLASSITIFTIAVFWCILLLGFKCIGPYGVGWLSGRLVPVIAKPEPSEYDHGVNDEHFQKDTDAWQLKYNKARRTRNILKGVIVLSCLGIIASAIVLSVKGYVWKSKLVLIVSRHADIEISSLIYLYIFFLSDNMYLWIQGG